MNPHSLGTPGRRPPGRRSLQAGQALTEMAVLAAVLVPLFLLVPMLAKYIHTKQVTQQAARAAAWEATVVSDYNWDRLSETEWHAQRRELLLDRHFGDPDAPIWTNPMGAEPDVRVDAPMMNTFSDQPLLERNDVELVSYTNADPGAITGVLESAGSFLEKLPGAFPPNKDGLVTAGLVVRPENLKTADGGPADYLRPFDALNLEFSSSHTLLADTWGASGARGGDRSVHEQVKTLVPTSYASELTDAVGEIDFLESIPLLGVPARLRLGYIEPDIVPGDRLQPYEH